MTQCGMKISVRIQVLRKFANRQEFLVSNNASIIVIIIIMLLKEGMHNITSSAKFQSILVFGVFVRDSRMR